MPVTGDQENTVDEHGIRHRHPVPAVGQFQLRSACRGCDQLYDHTQYLNPACAGCNS